MLRKGILNEPTFRAKLGVNPRKLWSSQGLPEGHQLGRMVPMLGEWPGGLCPTSKGTFTNPGQFLHQQILEQKVYQVVWDAGISW